ncbi:hypothetical protein LTR96_010425 [Exophiala xenobiotica]|nr:hypothetical protein LTR41_001926 [Exophiala xenobiotica]KAK5530764.1 hypothetical protein LTR23_010164 [Chaetothyriales sp. CCFEE 6169]KAK5264154.1 hypothetical protein LTR96_010425 [Exophiala xenobiotica]KAK5426424.1 hypothetical protein LTR34_010110 [Exophiala xenobiotica]KAK5438401.1 hypothetical protein LTR18_008923 [Exophiala xenobiotica]
MASIIPSGQSNELLYAIAAILVGSAIITYLLKFVNLDLKPFLSTKQGKALQDISSYLYERFLKALSVSDPLSPPSSPSTIVSRGYLETLPRRTGPRPIITGVSHPRQITHLSPEEKQVPDRLRQLISEVSARYPSTTYLGRSTFESIPSSPTTLYARHRIFNETRYYAAPTPSSQVLLYAPRDQADLDVLGQVVNAAVWWVGGIDARLDDEAF